MKKYYTVPILFIHGFGGGRYEFQPIIRFLKKKGFTRFYEFTYPKKHGEVSLTEISRKLGEFVKKEVKEKRINIIGISQGGIIARYYFQNNKQKKIDRFITLCAPHKGSLMGYLLSRPGFLDLRPKSKILEEIKKKKDKMEYFCVYTPFDLMVFPGWNAKLDTARENKMVLALLHPLAFWTGRTLHSIEKWLSK